MSLEYIRNHYNVPAMRGVRVISYGRPGVIKGSRNAYLLIRLDGEKRVMPYHPTDGIEYLVNEGSQEVK